LALTGDGAVWAWGDNGQGQLGNDTTTDSVTPIQVHDLTNVIAIATGSNHSLALTGDGAVWAWGDNGQGQLGNGTTTDSVTPAQVLDLTNVIAIAAGSYHSLALTGDGAVWAWGNNPYGVLGHGSSTPLKSTIYLFKPFHWHLFINTIIKNKDNL